MESHSIYSNIAYNTTEFPSIYSNNTQNTLEFPTTLRNAGYLDFVSVLFCKQI